MKKLEIYLGALQRQNIFNIWHEQYIQAGHDWLQEMGFHLMKAHIIVLLVSQYFLNSDYCYSTQMEAAMKRHNNGEARVLPVILRPVYYDKTPFSHLQPLPKGGKAIKSRYWRNHDEAFYHVSEGIRLAAENFQL